MQIYKRPEKIKVKFFIAAYEEENILENFSFHQKKKRNTREWSRCEKSDGQAVRRQ